MKFINIESNDTETEESACNNDDQENPDTSLALETADSQETHRSFTLTKTTLIVMVLPTTRLFTTRWSLIL